MNGELPNLEQKNDFIDKVKHYGIVHGQIDAFFNGFRRDAHPMAIIGVVGALSAFYHDSLDIEDPASRQLSAIRLISKMPTLAAMSYKYAIGQPFMPPKKKYDFSSNFLHMMFGTPYEDSELNPVLAKALDRIFILHADPRAKRIDNHGPRRGFDWSQPICLYLCWYRRTLGTSPRRSK